MALHEWFDRLGGLTPIEGNLHRSPLPFTDAHFRRLQTGGIRVIYSMEEAVPGPLARAHGFDWRPHFWTDDAPPTPRQMDAFLEDYLALPLDTPALVHCKAGWGRTGSAVACALMARHGWSAEQALRHFWTRVPRAQSVMTSNGQAEFVRGYGARLHGRGLD
ncbi:MAG: protein-tyrosine phosphatase family protein [Vicinamibacteria bacterium]